jgi:hypothetical protein
VTVFLGVEGGGVMGVGVAVRTVMGVVVGHDSILCSADEVYTMKQVVGRVTKS